jgi:hypothetical protein
MLHQVLAQLASFSINSVNNNLIEHGDNGTKLIIAPIQKIVKYAARLFDRMDNHVLKGIFPNSVPKFTPRDANPRYQIANVIVTREDRVALSISGDKKSKPDTSPRNSHSREEEQKTKAQTGCWWVKGLHQSRPLPLCGRDCNNESFPLRSIQAAV